MTELKYVILILILGIAGILLNRRHFANARWLLQAWADMNGYTILRARHRNLFMPLGILLSTSNCQIVYRAAVFDPSMQRIRSAWVRLGTYWTGSMDCDAVDVKWDEGSEWAKSLSKIRLPHR